MNAQKTIEVKGCDLKHRSSCKIQLTISAKEYARPGAYFMLVSQDLSQVKNPYIDDPDVTQDFGWK